MKGRKQRSAMAGNSETLDNLRKNTRSNTETTQKTDLPPPAPLAVVRGKRAGARMDKPVRGKNDAFAYKNGGSIHIKKSRKGLLHKDLGIPEDEKIPMEKIKEAEHSKSAKIRKRAHFADNAKTKFNH